MNFMLLKTVLRLYSERTKKRSLSTFLQTSSLFLKMLKKYTFLTMKPFFRLEKIRTPSTLHREKNSNWHLLPFLKMSGDGRWEHTRTTWKRRSTNNLKSFRSSSRQKKKRSVILPKKLIKLSGRILFQLSLNATLTLLLDPSSHIL